ncbi:S26 family signal peptidase [Natrinema halophilum]|uniref:S26 family signal peptidase n=1 Tax=Natrinema halophilum TaxID=1699371 RepID=A0A7D5H8R1_9EURY|nr:S26 family signal peptidase [Natrinema halophilum]QLG49775.1 S26 family signal peptidase [Natrinema halophilum]
MSGSSTDNPPDDSGDEPDRRNQIGGRAHRSEETTRSDSDSDAVTIADDGFVRWFLGTNDENVVMIRDILSSVAIVAVVGLLLFGVSGIWPPLVAVESGSMQPHMERGDLVFVVEEGRFVGDGSVEGTGVVTLEQGQETGYTKFGKAGDVVVFKPDGSGFDTPVIHRAHFWVEEGDKWVNTKANPEFTDGATCTEVASCPAPHDGFVTKGDNNPSYDQIGRTSGADTSIVKTEWIKGKSKYRIPWLGKIRLTFDRLLGGILVPEYPSSPPLQGASPATATASPTPAETGAPGFGWNGGFAAVGGVAGIAGAAVTIDRHSR